MNFRWIVFLLLIGFWGFLDAQPKYWICFADKNAAGDFAATELLSPEALHRRAVQGIPLDGYDLPVRNDYLSHLKLIGVRPIVVSRWLNAVSARLNDAQLDAVGDLPFVRAIQPVARLAPAHADVEVDPEDLGTYRAQLSQLNLDRLHALGFRGAGTKIAVLDNGYFNYRELRGFEHVQARDGFIYTRDLVEPGHDTNEPCRGRCTHGVHVLSIIAADLPGELVGSAPEADFMLFRTENDTAEIRQEEDAWLRAAELADSLGADVINSSLGYLDFDGTEFDYTAADLNGDVTLVTRAADIAASRGILVVTSAGNGGERGITAPADADSAIAVGAVDERGVRVPFSSVGPTADGRIKPDLMAVGGQTFFQFNTGEVRRGNGTSYSSPLIAGLGACLIQASGGTAPPMRIYDALIRSADRYETPDNRYGYGIPDAMLAFRLMARITPPAGTFELYPNPARDFQFLAFENPADARPVDIEMVNLLGQTVYQRRVTLPIGLALIRLEARVASGMYIVRVREADGRSLGEKKVIWTRD